MNADRGYPWLKIPTKLPFDPRYGMMSDTAKAVYLELYCLAGQGDSGGLIASAGGGYVLTNSDISFMLHRDPSTFNKILSELEKAKFIQRSGEGWEISGWMDEQGTMSQQDKREAWKQRQKDHRDRLRQEKETRHQEKEEEEEVTQRSRVTEKETVTEAE